MALASEDDVENALGRPLTSSEDVTTLLETASDLVVGFLKHTPDPVPDPVARVVADMVAAVLTKPAVNAADLNATKADGYNVARETVTVQVGNESATTSGPWLTKALKTRLNPFRTGSSRMAFSVATSDEDLPPWMTVDPDR